MCSWDDFINDFPYTNFSDINVSWFLNKFKQIFDEWQGLYSSLQDWKTATDEYNENWREEQETAFQNWENNFQSVIDEWKTQTENDIDSWESDTLENLETWKNAFIAQYNALKTEVEQIAEDAETAKNAAQASAQSAQQSATSAQASAESIAQQSAQIGINTNDISDLKETVYKSTGNKKIDLIPGYYVRCNVFPIDYTGDAIIASTTGYAYAIIDVLPGDKFTISSAGGVSARAWCFIDNDGNVKSIALQNESVNNELITAPEGATKLIINAKPLTDPPSYYGEFLVERFENSIGDISKQISNIKSDTEFNTENVEKIKNTIIRHESTNHYNAETKITGRLDVNNGTIDTSIDTSSTTDWISITPGTVVRTAYINNSNVLTAFGSRFVAYTAEKEYINGVSGVTSFNVPENAKYIRVGIANSYLVYPTAITFNTPISDYIFEPYFEPYNTYTEDFLTEETKKKLESRDTPFVNTVNTLSGTDVLRVAAPHAKRNYTISFRGKISTFGKIIVGIGKASAYLSGWIEIDSTNIYVYTKRGTNEVLAGTYTHGLTFSETINVDIHATGILTCEIILSTVGGMFKTESDWFGCLGFSFSGYAGRVTAETDGGIFTNCSIAYYCADYKKDIWGFGDSYFDHWPKIAIENNYDNFAIDGASGRHSDQAWHSLELESQKRLPKKILWCMGMNDADSETAVNASWKEYYNRITTFCEAYGIELILCTIPCVPERNNTFKNQIIRESGYRYVDIADAVGGTEAGSTWYEGLLESNVNPALRVHPTSVGDSVIAARFMADLPELMN